MLISFDNFKTFPHTQNLHNLRFNRINLIYGLNNSGKSSIIQLLKLFHYNRDNLNHIMTSFPELDMGSFENSLNSSSVNKSLKIFFSQGFVNRRIQRLTNKKSIQDAPMTSIGFEYNKFGILERLHLILVYPDDEKNYLHNFNNLRKKRNLTFFTFKKISEDYFLEEWQAAKNCIFFNIDQFVEEIYENRGAVEKKLNNVNRAYIRAFNVYKNLALALKSMNILSDKKSLLMSFLEEILDNESYEEIKNLDLHKSKIPTNIDKFRKILSKRRFSNSKNNAALLKNKILPYTYSELIKEIGIENPFLKKSKKETTEDKVKDFLKNNAPPPSVAGLLLSTKTNIKINMKNQQKIIMESINSLNLLYEFVDLFSQNINPIEINEFYSAIEKYNQPTDHHYKIFSKFNSDTIGKLKTSILKKTTKQEFKRIIEEVIDKSFIKTCEYVFTLDDFKLSTQLKNNILKIFSILDIPEDKYKSFGFLSNFYDILDNIYILNPLRNLISIDTSNFILNKRYYELEDFNSDSKKIYKGNYIIKDINDNINLLSNINRDLTTLGLDYNLQIKSNKLTSGKVLLEPVIVDCSKNKNFISTLFDSGQASKKIIPLLYYLNKVEDGIITIEEPEANIHPKYQANLADIFFKSLIEKNNELVIETHSELLILRFLKLIKEKKIDSNLVSVNFTNKEKKGSQIKEIHISKEGKLENNWPDGIFKERLRELL